MNNNFWKEEPRCIKEMGEEVFLKIPFFKRKGNINLLYVNEELYKKYFNIDYEFEKAKNDLEYAFNITVNEEYKENDEILGYAYVDRQKDDTDIALNGNKGSGRAYYIGKNFNLKGDKTPFATSTLQAYNNGKLSLDSAIHECIISNMLNKTRNYKCFKTLAVFTTNEKFLFPLNSEPIPCGIMIRVYEENELYRFSHRFVNNKVFPKSELTEVCKKIGILEGNKFIDRFLHGAWSTGNLSIEANLIDVDTSYFLKGRHPQWSFSEKYKTNFFGYEYLGQEMIIDDIAKSLLNIDKVNKEELNKIIEKYRFKQIKKRLFGLMGFDEKLFEKYDIELESLTNDFLKLSATCYENYNDYFVLTPHCNNTYLFDFSRFFKYYNILKNNNFNIFDALELLMNKNAENYIYDEKYEYMKEMFNDITVKNAEDFFKLSSEVVNFIKNYDSFNELVNKNENIDSKLKNAYIKNSDRTYLFGREFIRDELIYIYHKKGSKFLTKYMERLIELYSYEDSRYCDIYLFVEGIFYKEVTENNKINYIFEIFDNNHDFNDGYYEIQINNEVFPAIKVKNQKENIIIKTKEEYEIGLKESLLNIEFKILCNKNAIYLTKTGKETRFNAENY